MSATFANSLVLSEDPPAAKAAAESVPAQNARSLLPISVFTLSASAVLSFDLYWRKDGQGSFTLYRDHNYPLSQVDLERLKERGIETLYILTADTAEYRDYLERHVLADESIPAADRFQVLKEAAKGVFLESFRNKDVGRCLEVSGTVGQQMVKMLCGSQLALFDVFRVMAHDYGTFTHAMNVATYSLLLAQGLGIHDSEELVRIGQGALLHDFGKQFVPRQILEKKGPLDQEEQAVMRRHPVTGFLELSRREGLTWAQLMMVYQHHERCDGKGYPGGMTRGDIHDYARMCAIVDVTDALTRDRPYRKANSWPYVIEYLRDLEDRAYDKEMTECWTSMIEQN